MTGFFADPFAAHTDAVTALADAGIKPPTEWTKLAVRFHAFTNTEAGGYLNALADALITGTKADTDLLHTLALVDVMATPVHRAEVTNAVKAAVLHQLITAYQPAAVPNYLATCDLFDAAAQRFTAAAAVVDVEANADSIIHADNTTRSAWSDALLASQDLDRIAATLAVAASLAGIGTPTHETDLALTVDPGTTPRRAVWTAWESSGRCGHWSALITAGATIRAHRELHNLIPYRRPAPLEERWTRQPGEIGHTLTMHDPELETT